jgi:hypothetical protein
MEGVCGTVLPPPPHAPGTATQGVVQWERGQQVVGAANAFVQQVDGRDSLPRRLTARPVIMEDRDVHTQRRETGTVRMTTCVHKQEVRVEEALWRDEGAITRVPMPRVVDRPIPGRTEGNTTVISLVERGEWWKSGGG